MLLQHTLLGKNLWIYTALKHLWIDSRGWTPSTVRQPYLLLLLLHEQHLPLLRVEVRNLVGLQTGRIYAKHPHIAWLERLRRR